MNKHSEPLFQKGNFPIFAAKRPDYYLLCEYRDFFIDMAGRNNRSKISYSQN